MKNINYSETLDEFKFELGDTSSKRIKIAFEELKLNKTNIIPSMIILILSLVLSGFIVYQEESVKLIIEIASIILGVNISIFGCVFAVYAIIVSLMSDEYMKTLASIKHSKESYLRKEVSYFNNILFLYFIGMVSSGIFNISFKIFENYNIYEKITFVDPNIFNHILFLLISLYLIYNFRIFYEIKSLIFNAIIFLEMNVIIRFNGFDDNKK